MTVIIKPSEMLAICDITLRLGIRAAKLKRLKIIRAELSKLQGASTPVISTPPVATSHPSTSQETVLSMIPNKRDQSCEARGLESKKSKGANNYEDDPNHGRGQHKINLPVDKDGTLIFNSEYIRLMEGYKLNFFSN